MLLYDTFAAGRSPAAKFLLAACGLAGCAGPNVSASAEAPSALVRSEDRALAAGAAAGRAHVTHVDPRSIASRPVWTAGAQNVLTENPFAVTRGIARPTTPSVTRWAAAPSVRRVSHDQPAGAAIAATRPAPDATGVARVNDRRLPPAPPLGSANPFARSGSAATTAPPDATPVTARYASEAPAAQTPLPERRVSFRQEAEPRAPMPTFLSAGGGSGVTAGKVRHEDMIVDSSILPKRPEILPQPGTAASVDYTINPRRPFTSSADDEADAASPTATANLPIAITPSRRIEARPVSLSATSPATTDTPAAAIASTPESPAEPDESSDPFAGFDAPAEEEATETAEAPAPPADDPFLAAEEPVFAAEDPIFASDAPEELTETDAPPLLAPGPTLMAAVTRTEAAPAPPAMMTTAEEAPSRLAEHSGTAEVRGVEVTEGDRVAARQAASRSTGLNAPVTVGLALAAIAIGAVLVRRRFS